MPYTPPRLCRSVHYSSHGTPVREDGSQAFESVCRSAVVTEAHDSESASLCVLSPTGFFFPEDPLKHDPEGRPGTWHWPQDCPRGE
jgi:hypothetical protein